MQAYNQYIYALQRRRFGRQCLFGDRTQLMLSIYPNHRLRLSYILRNPVSRATQYSDQKALSIVETENVTHTEHGMFHYEGGWPKEVNINDEEQTTRYRRKIERDDTWGMQVSGLIRNAIDVAHQNASVNIYQDFFDEQIPDMQYELRSLIEACQKNIFHDPLRPGRSVICSDWNPTETRKFMALHAGSEIMNERTQPTDSEFTERPIEEASPNAFFIWDIKNPLKPNVIFDGPEPIRKAMYCPKVENILSGGYLSGKVCVWDTRVGGFPLRICPLEAAHREAVSALCWVHSKSNTEFYSGSCDGCVKYWDSRDLSLPLHEILLDPQPVDEQKSERAQGVSVLEFEYTIPVRFIIGSDQGHIFIGNRKGMVPTETLIANYRIFSGPVRTIQRNPFFVKNFLITADWCAKIWAEECKAAPTTLLIKNKSQVLCGAWSTSRCSLFATGDANGELDFYDLLLSHRLPIFSIKYNCPVTHIQFRHDGEYVLVSLDNGDVQLLELEEAMKRSQGRDKALIAALFEREQLRCKLLEGRVEEMKLKVRTSTWEAKQRELEEDSKLKLKPLNPDDPDEFIKIIENDTEFKETFTNFKDTTMKVEKIRQDRNYIKERTEFEVDYDYDEASSQPMSALAGQMATALSLAKQAPPAVTEPTQTSKPVQLVPNAQPIQKA